MDESLPKSRVKKNVPRLSKIEEQSEKMSLTDIFGEFGRFQITLCAILMYTALLSNWNVIGYTFFIFPMDHWCARPRELLNVSVDSWKNLTLPPEIVHGKVEFSKCFMYERSGNRSDDRKSELEAIEDGEWARTSRNIVPCQEWEFDKSYFKSTIISQWSLTCENSWMASMTQSVYMAGFLIAVLLFGQIGDRYGRRPVLITCVILQLVFGLASAFSPNFIFFVVTRFFIAMGTHGFFTTAYVLLMELVSPPTRPKIGVSLGVGWSVGYLILPFLGWITRSWSIQQLVIGVSSIVLGAISWMFPESPRWLITMGRYDEARTIIERVAKLNKCYNDETPKLIDMYFQEVEKEKVKCESKNSKTSFIDLVRTPIMRKITLNMFLCWFVTSFVYYALSLNTHSLGGDPIVNITIAGSTEIPSLFIYYLVIKFIGRRRPLAFFLVVAGASCLITVLIPEEYTWLRVTLVMTGKCFVGVCFGIIYMYSVELFPTVVRNVGVGSCSTSARIGSMIAPFVKELRNAANEYIPVLVYGGVTILSGLLVLMLPETTNATIPDTIEEAEHLFKRSKNVKKSSVGSSGNCNQSFSP